MQLLTGICNRQIAVFSPTAREVFVIKLTYAIHSVYLTYYPFLQTDEFGLRLRQAKHCIYEQYD